MFPEVWKSKIMHNMITYKPKLIYDEYDILNLSLSGIK